MKNRFRRRFPPFLYILWGGFNAGALFGLLDALIILSLGLGYFNRMGSIVGLIAVDAFGMGLIGIASTSIGWLMTSRQSPLSLKLRPTISALILLGASISISGPNLVWIFMPSKGPKPPNPRNVVWITLDTLRSDAIGAGGNNIVRSPTIDRLFSSGVQFSNATCTVPMTTPSHASMLTSTIPAVHGAHENRYRLSPDNVTISEVLRDRGYRTAAIVSCFPLDKKFGLDQGFMLYDDIFGVPGDLRQASWLKWLIHRRMRGALERSATRTNSLAIPWITKFSSGSPFFLWVHYFEPHSPYMPSKIESTYYEGSYRNPRPYLSEEDSNSARAAMPGIAEVEPGMPEEAYLGEISTMDSAIQKLIEALHERRAFEESYLVIIADHGESFGEHGRFFTHGEDIFEPAMHIPAAMIGPGIQATVAPWLMSATDIAPTLLKKLGIPIPESMEGFDAIDTENARKLELIENYGIILAKNTAKQRGLRLESQKFIQNAGSNEAFFFDLSRDPGETDNVGNACPEKCRHAKTLLENGFSDADSRSISSDIDVSRQTLEKLQQLGYFK